VATDKQIAFLRRLASERGLEMPALESLDTKGASAEIGRLLAMPVVNRAPVTRLQVQDAGVYVLPDGAIVKAQANRAKDRVYALRWKDITTQRSLEQVAGGRVYGEWEYEQGLVDQVASEGRRMTLAEAKEFILRYGQCVRCSRKLKAAESVERGIGPVCVKYFEGGW
jgi:hypothetical protein